MAWIAPAIGAVGSIVGGWLGGGSKGTPATSESVPFDLNDPQIKEWILTQLPDIMANYSAASQDKSLWAPYAGDTNVAASGYEKNVADLLGAGINPGGFTPEERGIWNILQGAGERAIAGTDTSQLEKSVLDAADLAFNRAGGQIRLASNLYGSAGGSGAQGQLARAAGDMSTQVAATLAPTLLESKQADQNRLLNILGYQSELSQNPWRRAMAEAENRISRAGGFANLAGADVARRQNNLNTAINNWMYSKGLEQTYRFGLPQQLMDILYGGANATRLALGQKSQGGRAPTPGLGAELGYEIGNAIGQGLAPGEKSLAEWNAGPNAPANTYFDPNQRRSFVFG